MLQQTGHLVRLGHVPAGICRLGGLEESCSGAAGCVAPAEYGVEVVGHKDMPVSGQVLEMDEVVADPVAQTGFAVVEERVDGKEAQPVVHIERFLDGCGKRLVRSFRQELAELDQVSPVVLGGVGFLEINLPIRLGLLPQVGEVGFHASGSDGAVNVHRAEVVIIRKVAVNHVVVCVGAIHGIAGHGGVGAIQVDVNQARA